MQSVSSRIWTRIAVSISYDDNDYTTGTSKEACHDKQKDIYVENILKVKAKSVLIWLRTFQYSLYYSIGTNAYREIVTQNMTRNWIR